MSQRNWELVVDFLTYKLSQKGHRWSDFSDAKGPTTEAPKGPEAEMETPSTTTDNPACGPARHLLDSASLCGATGHGSSVDAPEVTSMSTVKHVLRSACDEFDVKYQQAFGDLTTQVHITPATACQSFEQIVSELFQDRANWGRIVAFFAFGGALCVQSADKELQDLVSQIATWMTAYLSDHLDPWIRDNGGWDTFAELHGRTRQPRAGEARDASSPGS